MSELLSNKIFLVIFIIIVVMVFFYLCEFLPTKKINKASDIGKLNLDNYDNLMIVAHPDDDSIWGGNHLLKENYLVVCITCGVVKRRAREFVSAMYYTNNKYLILGYPDKNFNKRDNWSNCYDKISNDIEFIINYKKWNKIVTHNREGEYGHIHHKMTSKIVSDLINKNGLTNLYHFGKYYSKDKLSKYKSELKCISNVDLKEKQKLLKKYKSQKKVIESFSHMLPYENFKHIKGGNYEKE